MKEIETIVEDNDVELTNESAVVLTERDRVRDKISIWHGSNSYFIGVIKELIGNSQDEAMQDKCSEITLTIKNSNRIVFKDNAKGIPVEVGTIMNGIPIQNYIVLFEVLFAGTKYKHTENTIGTNGVFLATLTYSSYRIKYRIGRPNGNIYQIEYKQGERLYDLKIVGKTDSTFTEIEFELDNEVWECPNFTFESLKAIAKPQSCITNAEITLTDEINNITEIYKYGNIQNYFKDYKKEMNNILKDDILISKSSIEVEAKVQGKKVIDEINFNLLFNFSSDNEILQKEFLNSGDLIEYGTIRKGIIKGLTSSFSKYMKDNKMIKKENSILSADITNGLNYICDFKSLFTEYENQTKKSTSVFRYVKVLNDSIIDFFDTYQKENPKQFELIAKKIELNVKSRSGAERERAKIASKLGFKPQKNVKIKMEGVKDCDMKHSKMEERIALSCEGKSAASTIAESMDSRIMGLISLRGRFINPMRQTVTSVLDNTPAYTLIKTIGTGIEIPASERKKFGDIKSFDINNLRYNKIGFVSDADSFGSSITLAQLTLIYKYAPQLIIDGHIYVVRTPRYAITIGKKVKYAYDKIELDKITERLIEKGLKYHIGIKKGLAEFDKDEFWDVVLSEEAQKKSFVQVKYNPNEKEFIDNLFDLYMGNNAELRKDFIQKNIISIEEL